MKIKLFISVLFFLFCLIFSARAESSKNEDARRLLAETYMINADYEKAEKLIREILVNDPENLQMRILLADIFAYSKKFKEAISLYAQILKENSSIEVKRKLADVLSWDKQYLKALSIYEEILNYKEDKKSRIQKARILGWQRRYAESAKEYKKILKEGYDELVDLELKAKLAYWNNRSRRAMLNYNALIQKDNKNAEAMFDLSQVYSYQGMFKEAINRYNKILDAYPAHFRAEAGKKKAELISAHSLLESGYEFFEADSNSRSEDINRHSLFSRLSIPVGPSLKFDIGNRLSARKFSDFNDILEDKSEVGFSYLNSEDWRLRAYYSFLAYNRNINSLHLFGTQLVYPALDTAALISSFDRKQLESTSYLIRNNYYSDNYQERVEFNFNKRFNAAADYLFSYYSDSNYKNEAGFDLLYLVMLEPKRLSLKYRYFCRSFDEKVPAYFSPSWFSANSLKINWRHFLNKEEIFFGADDLYYDIGYSLTVDLKGIVSHNTEAGLNWDINKRFNFNIKGSVSDSSASVYQDKNLTVAVKYYF